MVSVGVNELTKSTSRAGDQPPLLTSPVYLGGIPQELQASYRHLTLEQGKFPSEANTIGHGSGPPGIGHTISNMAVDVQ